MKGIYYLSHLACKLNQRYDTYLLSLLVLSLLALTASPPARAWALKDLFGPSLDDIDFSYTLQPAVKSPPIKNQQGKMYVLLGQNAYDLLVTLTNKSGHFIKEAVLLCDYYDADGNRIAKKVEKRVRGSAAIAPGNTVTWKGGVSTIEDIAGVLASVQCKLDKVISEEQSE